ncbi:MAG: division/cell wall cluster transcriptional repressor MraZ [Gammaproteobacteria bacterium]|nr:division/cell wall cluster transcriptional repressor MraZ [Gammaproteobacteria bacterium]MCB1849183.1 division/cell wall cluster transcriptional repressor MraZ [Gammaproteobacteria bacterium]MCP5415783.1 division/cell wall cluster transcriptional repressor MraZ [Chromatiaceae bacterium]
MFRGINRINLDVKGRLAIPTRYRERLQEYCASELVITVDPDRCLLIYPLTVWVKIEKQLMELPTFNESTRTLQRLLVGYATEVQMDGQGRVLLPPPLREFAGLQKQTVMIGQGARFELWDETRWNDKQGNWLEKADLKQLNLSPELGNISI